MAAGPPGRNRLVAYPAQSNYCGVQHPLEWIAQARARSWDALLNWSAFVPTNE
jgi:selenocysteine lyase/cysteine desulfurase